MSLVSVLFIAGHSLPTALHMVGILLLYKIKGGVRNQRVITLNLAIAEMLFCLVNVIILIISLMNMSLSSRYIVNLYCLFGPLFCVIRFAILHIIIDRFLYIWLNIKYPIYLSSRNLKIIIISQ